MDVSKLVDFIGPHPSAMLQNMHPQDLEDMKEAKKCALIRSILVMIIIFVLILLLGKWLWNRVLVPHVTIVRPVENIWPILGLIVLFGILRGGLKF